MSQHNFTVALDVRLLTGQSDDRELAGLLQELVATPRLSLGPEAVASERRGRVARFVASEDGSHSTFHLELKSALNHLDN